MTEISRSFDELKSASLVIWGRYDNQYGYVDEKRAVIDRLSPVDYYVMVNMFDYVNQSKLLAELSRPVYSGGGFALVTNYLAEVL